MASASDLQTPTSTVAAVTSHNATFAAAAEEAKRSGHYESWIEGVKLGIQRDHLDRSPGLSAEERAAFKGELNAHAAARSGYVPTGEAFDRGPSLTRHEGLADSYEDLAQSRRSAFAKDAAEKIGPAAVEAQLHGYAFGMEHAERSASLGHVDSLTAQALQELHFSGAVEQAQRAGHYDSWREGVMLGIQQDRLARDTPAAAETRAFQEELKAQAVARTGSPNLTTYEAFANSPADLSHTHRMGAAKDAAERIGPEAVEAQLRGHAFGMEYSERSASFGHIDKLTANAVQNLHFSGAADHATRAGHYDSWLEGVKLGIEQDHLERNPPTPAETRAFQEGLKADAVARTGQPTLTIYEAYANSAADLAHTHRMGDAKKAAQEIGHEAVEAQLAGHAFGMEHAARNAEMGVTRDFVKESAEHGVGTLAKDAVKVFADGPVGDAMAVKDVVELSAKAPSISSLLDSDIGYKTVAALAAGATGAAAKHFADEHGLTEKVAPAIAAARHQLEPAAQALHTFHEGVHSFIEKSDAIAAKGEQYVQAKLDPITKPVEHVAAEALAHVAKAAEPLTGPVEERMAAIGAMASKGWDAAMSETERREAQAVQQTYGALLRATDHASPGLTNEEARMVRAELPNVQKGDVFVVEPQGAMHLVPAGTKMPEFPVGSLHLDADALREAAGVQRAPQQVAQADVPHAAARER
jgi:hypothetical protein